MNVILAFTDIGPALKIYLRLFTGPNVCKHTATIYLKPVDKNEIKTTIPCCKRKVSLYIDNIFMSMNELVNDCLSLFTQI